jgi:hypothetical protein
MRRFRQLALLKEERIFQTGLVKQNPLEENIDPLLLHKMPAFKTLMNFDTAWAIKQNEKILKMRK